MLMANMMRMVPDILLMMLILYGVSWCLIFAAINTFKTSAMMFTPKHAPNKTILSERV